MYKKIVIAIDLSKDSQKVIDTAVELAGNDSSKLNLVHVIEPITGAYNMDIYAINIGELQQEAKAAACQHLEMIGNTLNVGKEAQFTLHGVPAVEIRNLAKELGAEAIVIGSHGHDGWKILLGSTANKVLHGAICDVLVVHVGEDD